MNIFVVFLSTPLLKLFCRVEFFATFLPVPVLPSVTLPHRDPAQKKALMMKSHGAQDIGSNETPKEQKNNIKKGERSGKPADDIPVHMPTMSHNDAISAM